MSRVSPIISVESDDRESAGSRISALLEDANRDVQRDRARRHFCATLRGADGTIEGGVTAQAFWGWLYIAEFAIKPEWRGRGYGRQLLALAEAWGVQNGCLNAWLMTMSFQAKGFYENAGYAVFAELADYPPGESRFFLRKTLLV